MVTIPGPWLFIIRVNWLVLSFLVALVLSWFSWKRDSNPTKARFDAEPHLSFRL